jgi:iron complex outermembrane receptor protein
MRARSGPFLLTLLMSAVAVAPAASQQATIAGTVTDAGTGQPLSAVEVAVQGQGTGALTNQAGRFAIPVNPGTYSVIVSMIGYEQRTVTGVRVAAGQTTNVGIALALRAVALDPIQVSVGKKAEKATEAPATVSVISEMKIEEKVVATPIEHMKDVVGVDIINYGLSAGNVVVRGFNNIFSGALHFLTDNRVASIPSLQVNLMQFVPSTDEDISRIEVVLGPGSALYGPNTANGVLHFITRSPLEGTQTTASVAGGERSVFKGVFRTSQLLHPKFGVKVSGSMFRGKEWEFADSVEVQARRECTTTAAVCRAKVQALYPTATAPEVDAIVARIGTRDYDIMRWGGEVRADWRFVENGTLILQAGRSSNDGIELTGLGGGQTNDWAYSFYQARANVGRLFLQTYMNTSDAGESFLLRQGGLLVDKSKMWVAQAQNGTAFADDRVDLVYGVDYKRTTPDSEGTIYGMYENADRITEFGAYVQTELSPVDKLQLVGALRYDESTVMEDPVWSPRAALVFTPKPAQSFRASYNRAFSTPSTLNFFLDINGGRAPSSLGQLGFLVRATGPGPDGLQFQTGAGTFGGMRSPFTPAALGGPKTLQPISVPALWGYAMGVLLAQRQLTPAQFTALTSAPVLAGAAQAVRINSYDPVTANVQPLASTVVPDVPRLEPSTTTTYELGYQGVLADKLGLAADVWWSNRDNFTSPLTVWTPLLALDRATTQAFLTGVFQAQGQPPAVAAATAAAIAGGIGSVPTAAGVAGQPGVPLAVISSNDISQPAGADIITTYVNYGEVDLSGADVSLTAFLTNEWTLGLTGSLVSDDHFRLTPATKGAREQVVALNAPDKKGTVTIGYRGVNSGVNAELRGRFTSGFPANSAGYVGTECVLSATELAQARATGLVEPCVESASVFDVTAGYHFPNTGATVQLYVSNLFDSDYRNFVGVPNIGRLALLQLKYEF